MFEFFNFLITPLILSIIVSAAVMIISFKATKPSGCLMTGAVIFGGSIIAALASLYTESFADSLFLTEPPIDDSVKVERLFYDQIAGIDVDSSLYLRFLVLTDGEHYGVFRDEACSIDRDYLECPQDSYAFFRSKRVDLEQCQGEPVEGKLQDHITIGTERKTLNIVTIFFEDVPKLGAPIKYGGGQKPIPYYQLCVEFQQVDAIPDDALAPAIYDEQEFAYGYILERRTHGLRHYRNSYGDIPAEHENFAIDAARCAKKSVNAWLTISGLLFGPFFQDGMRGQSWFDAKVDMGCADNELARYYRPY